MKQVAVFAFLLCVAGPVPAALAQTGSSQADFVTLPARTTIELAITAPVWARTAKPGDALYAQVDFPVLAGKSIAIPAGTYVQGTILSIARPSRFKSRAEIQAVFTTIIFAGGYVIQLPALPGVVSSLPGVPAIASEPQAATVIKLTIEASSSNDLLLDNGAEFDIVLASPLSLDSKQLAAAISASRLVDLGQFKSATLCRPTPATPGTPGTSDTVIPGTPGTPSTTIPGGPGQPDITIPGTPGTPPTVIPGTPGTPGFPGRACPNAPLVVSSQPVSTTPAPGTASASPNNP